jgi:hypothetical protein
MSRIKMAAGCFAAILLFGGVFAAASYAGEPNWKVGGKFMDLNEERPNAEISGKLKFAGLQLGGQEVEFECDTEILERLIGGGVDAKGVDHPGTDEAISITLKNCAVIKPAKCVMNVPLAREPAGKAFWATKLVVKGGKIYHEIANLEFLRIEFKNNGAEVCALAGKKFKAPPNAYLYQMANLTGKIQLALLEKAKVVNAEMESESSEGEVEGSEIMSGPEGQTVEVGVENEDGIETAGAVIGELAPVNAKAATTSTLTFAASGSNQEFEELSGTRYNLETEIDGLGAGTFPFKSVEIAAETLKGSAVEIKSGAERGTCKAAKKGAGEYLNATCTEPGAKGGPKMEFAWVPVSKPSAFMSRSGEVTLKSFTPEDAELPAVTCAKSKGKGKVLSPTTTESTITFEGCTSSGEKCTGGAKAKAGQIITFTLDGTLGTIAGGSEVGEAISGAGGVIAEFEC